MVYLRQIKDSIINFKAYSIFAQQSFRKTFIFLIVFTLLFGSLNTLKGVVSFNSTAQRALPVLGRVSITPHADGSMDIVCNTPLVVEDKGLFMLIYTPELIDALSNKGDQSESISTHLFIQSLLVTFLFFLLNLLFFLTGKLISAFFLSYLAIILSYIQKAPLPFAALYKISLYALTLPGLIQVARNYIYPEFPFFSIFYYILAGIYLWHAIKAVKAGMQFPTECHPYLQNCT